MGFVFWNALWMIILLLPMKVLLKPDKIKLSSADELDARNRYVSLIHGIILVIFSAYHYYAMFQSCGDPNEDFESNLIFFSISYFIYDFIAMAYYGLLDGTMVFHHLIVIMIMGQPFYRNSGACMVVRGMFMTEISNPFMHIRCILKHYGLRYTLAYETCEVIFYCAYPFGRIFIGTNLLYVGNVCQHVTIGLKIGFWGLYLQSLYFSV